MSAKALAQTGVLFTDRRDFYISPNMVKELWTDIAPFTTIVSNREIRNVQDPDFKLFEHRSGWINQKFLVNDGSGQNWASTGAAGEVSDGLTIDGIVGLNATADDSYIGLVCEYYSSGGTYKGLFLIYDVDSTTTIDVKSLGNPRSATNVASAFEDNDVCYVVGNAFGEGTEAPEAFSDELEVIYNSTQIFKTSVEITGTLYANALRGYSSELERLRMEKNKEHKMQKERSFLFGQRPYGVGATSLAGTSYSDAHATHVTDADSKTVRMTMGIIPFIYKYGDSDVTADDQNIFTIDAATYRLTNFVDDMEKLFQYIPTSGEKVALCGPKALSYWSKVGGQDGSSGFVSGSGIEIALGAMERDTLGFNFRRLVTPHGILRLVYAPALRGPYNNMMLVIDQENLFMAQYRAAKFQANVKTDNAYDGVKDQWFSDEGLGLNLVERHAIFTITNS